MKMKQRSCDGPGGAQRPAWHVNKPNKTGARSARAPTSGQNTLVMNNCTTVQISCHAWTHRTYVHVLYMCMHECSVTIITEAFHFPTSCNAVYSIKTSEYLSPA